jgi:hypothetical protein
MTDIVVPYADPAFPRIAWKNFLCLPGTTVTVSSENASFPHENAYDWNESSYWQPASGGASWLQCVLPKAQCANYVGLHATTLAANGGSYDLQYSLDSGTTWTSVFGGPITPTQNFDSLGNPTGMPVQYRSFSPVVASYWRFWMTSSSPSMVGILAFGMDMKMERGCWTGMVPPSLGRSVLVTNSMTVAGKFVGRSVIRKNIQSSFKFEYLTEAFIRGQWMPFVVSAERYPFFVLWNNVNFPWEAVFAWSSKDIPSPQNQAPGSIRYMSVSIDFDGNAEA